jgi:hypothetical protein
VIRCPMTWRHSLTSRLAHKAETIRAFGVGARHDSMKAQTQEEGGGKKEDTVRREEKTWSRNQICCKYNRRFARVRIDGCFLGESNSLVELERK